MPYLAIPPHRPGVGLTGNDGARKVQLRIWQFAMVAVTLALTGWFCTMGVIPALIALFMTKHVLVAIYVAGLKPAKEK